MNDELEQLLEWVVEMETNAKQAFQSCIDDKAGWEMGNANAWTAMRRKMQTMIARDEEEE